MKAMVLAVVISSSSTQSVAFFNCSSILIIVEALSSENKFLEPLCPVVVCLLLYLPSRSETGVSGKAAGGVKTVVYSSVPFAGKLPPH